MMRALLLLALLAAGLFAWDRALVAREAGGRAAGLRIAPLLPEDERADRGVAALRVEQRNGESWLYGQSGGLWRCLSWKGAIADAARVTDVVRRLGVTQGMLVNPEPSRPQDYGFDVPEMLTLSLHGARLSALDASQDRILALDVGKPLVSQPGCFVRRHGSPGIWAADLDVHALLDRADHPREPPLLDRALVPAAWPGQSPRVKRLRIEREGQPPCDLILRSRRLSSEEALKGAAPFEWSVRRDGVEVPHGEILVITYSAFVLLAEGGDLVDDALFPRLGFDRPRAQLLLVPPDGEPLKLLLGGRAPSGRPVVLNSVTGLMVELAPELEPLLFPAAEAFSPEATVNPWQEFVDRAR